MAVLPAYPTLPDSTLAPKAVLRKFSMAGIGACGDQTVDPETGTIIVDTANCAGSPYSLPPITPSGTPGVSSDPWGFWTALARGGTDIAKLLAIQPGTVLTPQGGVSMQNPGYPVTGTLGNATSGVSNSLMSLLPIILIGGLVIMMVKK